MTWMTSLPDRMIPVWMILSEVVLALVWGGCFVGDERWDRSLSLLTEVSMR